MNKIYAHFTISVAIALVLGLPLMYNFVPGDDLVKSKDPNKDEYFSSSFYDPESYEDVDYNAPTGTIVTHTVGWDLGVIDFVPHGYVEFYDSYAADNAVTSNCFVSDVDTNGALVASTVKSQNLLNHFMPNLLLGELRSISTTFDSEGEPVYSFTQYPSSNSTVLNQKITVQDDLNDQLPTEDKYLSYYGQSCAFETVDAVELPGIYRLKNFQASVTSVTSSDLDLRLTCLPSGSSLITVDANFDLTDSETDPNGIVTDIANFLALNEHSLDDSVYVYSDTGLDPVTNSMQADLMGAYMYPVDLETAPSPSP